MQYLRGTGFNFHVLGSSYIVTHCEDQGTLNMMRCALLTLNLVQHNKELPGADTRSPLTVMLGLCCRIWRLHLLPHHSRSSLQPAQVAASCCRPAVACRPK